MAETEPVVVTVAELAPGMKNLTVTFKVLEKNETREVSSRRDGQTHRVADAIVGDATGIVVMPLWNESIETIEVEKTYKLENGYTGLFQGHLRLNIGKYGVLADAEEEIPEVNRENDLSEAEHERPRRYYGGGGYGRDRRGGGGGYGRDRRGGGDYGRDDRGGGRDRRGYRDY
jgi:replication factor A1